MSLVAKGWGENIDHKDTQGNIQGICGDGNILYLDCGQLNDCLCQTHRTAYIKRVNFTACEVYSG